MSTSVGTTQCIDARPFVVRPAVGKAPARTNADKDDALRALMRAAQDGDRGAYASLLQQVLPILKRVVQEIGRAHV